MAATSGGQDPRERIGVGGFRASAKQREYVLDVLATGRLSYGPYHRRFEEQFAARHGRSHAVFANSGTSALQVALHALKEQGGWADGDEVLVPAITFVATINIVLQNGLTPVLVDVEPDHFGMDPARIPAAITPRTRVILPVHLFGQSSDMRSILAIARERGLRVLEDACETMFVSYAGQPVGALGDIACYSTYVAHLLVTGVGGLACTNDPSLAALMRSLINHGRDAIYLSIDDSQQQDPERLRQVVQRRFRFLRPGYSYRATELEAALGLAALEGADGIVARRQHNAGALTAALMPLRGRLRLPAARPEAEHAFMMYPLVVDDPAIDRDGLMVHLERQGIDTRELMPITNQPVYAGRWGARQAEWPVADQLNRRGFYVGCHDLLTEEEMGRIGAGIRAYCGA